MSSTYMKIMILGNVGRAPELQYLPDGRAVTDFSVAVNRGWKDRKDRECKETTWVKAKAWGRLAELCCDRLQKGSRVFIEGRLAPDRSTGSPHIWYSGSSNEPRASYDVTILHISFVSNLKPRENEKGGENGTNPDSIRGLLARRHTECLKSS